MDRKTNKSFGASEDKTEKETTRPQTDKPTDKPGDMGEKKRMNRQSR